MTKLIVKAKAKKDLRAIARYIAQDNPERAHTFAEELIGRMKAVGENPLLYRLREEWGSDHRSAVHKGYHIVFRVTDSGVHIVRVLHGSQDIVPALGS